jgi:PP-loop superfamily ATP-utilizing enzyme
MTKIIGWWSGGVTSAVACYLAIQQYGKENCRVIMLDTGNEHYDTYRFKGDCEKWYGLPIEVLKSGKYRTIQDTWYTYNSLNTANGAICSYMLKRKVREDWEKENDFDHQIFGFEFDSKEFKRAMSLKLNHPNTKPLFPLLQYGLTKKDCIEIVEKFGLILPMAYLMGFQNNNCLNTGCVQGGIGYWKKMQSEMPENFERMAQVEHDLTDRKGKPVTMLKDQSKQAKERGIELVFLKPHPDYPKYKCLDDMQGRPVEPLMECNGFCGVNDLIPNNEQPTQFELAYED